MLELNPGPLDMGEHPVDSLNWVLDPLGYVENLGDL